MPAPRHTFFIAHAGPDLARARELRDRLHPGVSTFLDAARTDNANDARVDSTRRLLDGVVQDAGRAQPRSAGARLGSAAAAGATDSRLLEGADPVTNEGYGRFVAATRHREPEYWRNARFNKADQPVVGVSFDDAAAFCAWATNAGTADGEHRFDLPTEAQWEYAARAAGGDGSVRRYPWGNEDPSPERAVFAGRTGATAAVGGRTAGATPLGVHDMAGNVWEWCLDAWSEYPKLTAEQVDVDPLRASPRAAPRVVRGGSWFYDPGYLRAADRGRGDPGGRVDNLGFRVVCVGSRQHVGP